MRSSRRVLYAMLLIGVACVIILIGIQRSQTDINATDWYHLKRRAKNITQRDELLAVYDDAWFHTVCREYVDDPEILYDLFFYNGRNLEEVTIMIATWEYYSDHTEFLGVQHFDNYQLNIGSFTANTCTPPPSQAFE